MAEKPLSATWQRGKTDREIRYLMLLCHVCHFARSRARRLPKAASRFGREGWQRSASRGLLGVRQAPEPRPTAARIAVRGDPDVGLGPPERAQRDAVALRVVLHLLRRDRAVLEQITQEANGQLALARLGPRRGII